MMMNLIAAVLVSLLLMGIAATRKSTHPVRVRVRVRPEDRNSRR